MGGKAFAGKTRRFERDEYFDLTGEVGKLVRPLSTAFVVIPAYNEKPSFGDMDVLFTPSTEISKQLLMSVLVALKMKFSTTVVCGRSSIKAFSLI